MGYWGWRPMVMCAFLSVWIAACTDNTPAAPGSLASNDLPSTLIVRTPGPPIPTIMPGLPTLLTLNPNQTASTQPSITPGSNTTPWPYQMEPSPTPVLLNLPQPTCYDSPQGGIICFGYVENTQDYPVKNIVVAVDLFNTIGQMLDAQETAIEQQRIPAGEQAPYRIYFTPSDDLPLASDFGTVRVRLLRAEETTPPEDQWIQIQSHQGTLVEDQFYITLDLHNTIEKAWHDVRIVATLYDTDNQVMGYRIVELGTLAGHAIHPLTINIIPNTTHVPLHYTLFVEYAD